MPEFLRILVFNNTREEIKPVVRHFIFGVGVCWTSTDILVGRLGGLLVVSLRFSNFRYSSSFRNMFLSSSVFVALDFSVLPWTRVSQFSPTANTIFENALSKFLRVCGSGIESSPGTWSSTNSARISDIDK